MEEIDVSAFPSCYYEDSEAPRGKNGPDQRQEYRLQVRRRIRREIAFRSESPFTEARSDPKKSSRRHLMIFTPTAGLSAVRLAQQLAEHKRQDAPVTVVVHLNGRIDAKLDRLFNNGTILTRDAQGDVLTRHDIIGKPEHIGDLSAVKAQGLSGDASGN